MYSNAQEGVGCMSWILESRTCWPLKLCCHKHRRPLCPGTVLCANGTRGLRRRHVVIGQYLGFSGLVAVSLVGFVARLIFPEVWIGLLGLMPIAIGVRKALVAGHAMVGRPPQSANHAITSVAAVTFANGGDNIGIYMPLFASSGAGRLGVILAVFYALIGVWCVIGLYVGRRPVVARALERYGHILVPIVLIALGIYILWECGTLGMLGALVSGASRS
jgi:cadmium resistance protein CadD (predicted permease)